MSLWTTKAHQLLEAQAKQVAEIVNTTDDHITYRTTAAGDQAKLRGIPAIGRGVPGCIPGTSPHNSQR
jgi:hypothetical protein